MPGQSEAGTFILGKGFSPQSHLPLLLTRLLPGVSQLRELPAIMGPNGKPVFQHPPCSRAAGERPQRAGKEPQNCESLDCCRGKALLHPPGCCWVTLGDTGGYRRKRYGFRQHCLELGWELSKSCPSTFFLALAGASSLLPGSVLRSARAGSCLGSGRSPHGTQQLP